MSIESPQSAPVENGGAKRKKSKIVAVGGVIGSALIGLFITKGYEYLEKDTVMTTKVYGSVFEKKQVKQPVSNAIINFINLPTQERTNVEGRFSASLQGTKSDSVTIEIKLPDGQAVSQKIWVDYQKKEMHLSAIEFPIEKNAVIREIPKPPGFVPPVPDKSSSSTIAESTDPPKVKESRATDEKISNATEQTGIAVMATRNNRYDGPLSDKLKKWALQSGKASQSALQGAFISQGYFDKMFSGNSAEIKKILSSKTARYVCLLRSDVSYTSSAIEESLRKATLKAEVVIVDAATGEVLNSFDHTEKASDISEEKALERAEQAFLVFLQTQTLNL